MKIFIDDSGSFGWGSPGMSLFCGISVADSTIPDLFVRFFRWKQRVGGRKKGTEVKASSLNDEQLVNFAQEVIRPRDVWLTVVGTDTTQMQAGTVDLVKKQSAEVLNAASKWASRQEKPILARQYKHMAGWLRNRSPENYLWIICLEHTIYSVLQHTIARFLEPEFDQEFENLEIVVDRSFIRVREAIANWKELLRNGLLQLSEKRPMAIPDVWGMRNHPFTRMYGHKDKRIMNATHLYKNHLHFDDSRTREGLQFADILANICYRYRRNQKQHPAYDLIRPYIVGIHGTEMQLILLDERSLHRDAPEQHVRPLDIG